MCWHDPTAIGLTGDVARSTAPESQPILSCRHPYQQASWKPSCRAIYACHRTIQQTTSEHVNVKGKTLTRFRTFFRSKALRILYRQFDHTLHSTAIDQFLGITISFTTLRCCYHKQRSCAEIIKKYVLTSYISHLEAIDQKFKIQDGASANQLMKAIAVAVSKLAQWFSAHMLRSLPMRTVIPADAHAAPKVSVPVIYK